MNSLLLKLWRRKFSMRKRCKAIICALQIHLCSSTSSAYACAHTHTHTLERKEKNLVREECRVWVSFTCLALTSRQDSTQSVSRQLHSFAAGRWLRAQGTMAALRIYKAQLSRGRPEVTSNWSGAKPLGCLKHGGSVLGLFSDSSRQHLTGVR